MNIFEKYLLEINKIILDNKKFLKLSIIGLLDSPDPQQISSIFKSLGFSRINLK